ncbi:MAG: PEGA domain-containing protein [Treponema sp.]|jgi:hypothetical protein|nr:PEGA domain-containing protein [Treponema sp.]
MTVKRVFLTSLMFYLGIWLFGLSGFSEDRIEELEGKGLHIRTNPAGAKVFIDGIERGNSPLILENIEQGIYNIRLEKEGYKARRFRARVHDGSRLFISIEMEEAQGKVLLSVKPAAGSPPKDKLAWNPVVIADGKQVFDSAVTLQTGFRTFRASSFGWEDASETVFIAEDSIQSLNLELKPAQFRLSSGRLRRNRFNPDNAGALGIAEINFEVSAPGTGSMSVFDSTGEMILSRNLPVFQTWSQHTSWNGRKADGTRAPDGAYQVKISAQSIPWDDTLPREQSISLEVAVDSSVNIYPLSIAGGIPGLIFAPVPGILPPGAFQIEAAFIAGALPVRRSTDGGTGIETFRQFPFAVGFRFSVTEQVEISAEADIGAFLDRDSVWGLSGSAKWLILNPQKTGFTGLAAGMYGAWSNGETASPFLPGNSTGLFLPLSFRLSPAFFLLLSPVFFLDLCNTEDIFLNARLAAGIHFYRSFITGGLSVSLEHRLTGAGEFSPVLHAGAELKYFPPPSNLVFTLTGGVLLEDKILGGFGGLGLGLIF